MNNITGALYSIESDEHFNSLNMHTIEKLISFYLIFL